MRKFVLTIILIGLAACQTEEDTMATPADEDACGAASLQELVGQPVAGQSFEGEHRIIPPNSAVTMDYRAERLNIATDATGKITRIYCG